MRKLALLVLSVGLLTAVACAEAPRTVSGKVFLDANGNGWLDAGERGIPGVRVTDSVGFVTTGPDGSYTIRIADDNMIPYRPAQVVSVSWPTGKWPTGKWWARLSEVQDAKGVHFPLRDDEQKLPLVFLHLSDDHSSGEMLAQKYAADARQMAGVAKFCFNTGDMGYATAQGAVAMFTNIRKRAGEFPVPMFIVPGNHDFVGEEKDARLDNNDLAGNGAYTRYLGPVRWSFDYAGVHFAGIDYMEKTRKGYQDEIPLVACQWLDRDLSAVPKGTRTILLVHYPFGPKEFYRTLAKYNVSFILSGHTHVPIYARYAGVPGITNYGLAIGVVTQDAVDVAENTPRAFRPRTAGGYFKSVVCPALEKRRLKQHTAADKTLNSATALIDGGYAEASEIVARIIPGGARKFGLRIGDKDAVEIAFDGKAVRVAGAPVPFWLAGNEKALDWHILVHKDRLAILVNDQFWLTKAIQVDKPARVTLLAEGGIATFQKVDVWELRPVRNGGSKGLHFFPPPAWTWGTSQHTAACLEEDSNTAREILKRYSQDGVTDYDNR